MSMLPGWRQSLDFLALPPGHRAVAKPACSAGGTGISNRKRCQGNLSPDTRFCRLIPTPVLPPNPDTLLPPNPDILLPPNPDTNFAAPSRPLVWPGRSTRNTSAMGIMVEHTFSEE